MQKQREILHLEYLLSWLNVVLVFCDAYAAYFAASFCFDANAYGSSSESLQDLGLF